MLTFSKHEPRKSVLRLARYSDVKPVCQSVCQSVSQSVHLILLRSIWSHRLGHICPALLRLRDRSFLLRLSSVSARATFCLYVSSSSSSDTISQSFFHSVNQSVSGLSSGHQQVGYADSQSVSQVRQGS